MKKLLLFVALILSVIGVSAQPLLVGHRGSGYGVENTEEAFRKGAELGYAYVETDIKVTKDTRFVLIHNDDLSAFGSSLTVTGSTLEQLQAVELTQKRSGVTYTGHLMSLEEMLDLCEELGVKPLIELKWATGVNSNDCSNIPLLIKTIEDKGFRNKCIILTSMKPCLENIRTNYPDIELQYLVNSVGSTTLDWCVEWGIDVDIRSDGCNKGAVDDFHAQGLKVNMWTTNDEAGYKTYGNMGCDFITTDRLDGNNLPDLDEVVTYPINLIDYPKLELPVKGEYTPEIVSEIGYPEALKGLNVKRALLRDGRWVVLAHDAANVPTLLNIDAASGESSVVNTEGVAEGDILLGDIAFTADDKLVACNVATVPFEGGGAVLKLYIWEDLAAAPKLLATIDNAKMLGNWTNAYAGETMALSGRSNNLLVYIATRSAGKNVYRIAGVKIDNGILNAEEYCYALDNSTYTLENWGDFLMNVSPVSRNNIVFDSPIMDATEFVFDWGGTRIPMTYYGDVDSAVTPSAATGISFFRQGIKVYAAIPSCAEDGSKATASVYECINGLEELNPVCPVVHEGLGSEIGLMASAMEYVQEDGATYLYLFAENQGLLKVIFDKGEELSEPEPVSLAFERVWINSLSTDNAPTNIDGTNAQQGTAVKGYFYINDCEDRLVYVFNENGLVGSIPGGSGWGCARDDAGNIVVRDDKDTGTTRKFIIHTAGALPDNYAAPVEITAEGVLEGQANFINASGDLINGKGHIYLFPKDMNEVCIIEVENGAITSVKVSATLSLTATAAGYVVPIGDNTESWYYQVRNSGIYRYNGGMNEEVLTTSASSKPGKRNSTGGFAMPIIKGNKILLHNSGANYKGGFVVKNLTTDEEISYVEPIGTLGYEDGGNYSTFNWLIAEKVDDTMYTIYQYCPANGMACYKLYDMSGGVEDVVLEVANDKLSVYVDGDKLVFIGAEARDLRIYNMSGMEVLSVHGTEINISSLPAGIYIAKSGNKSAKFVKK